MKQLQERQQRAMEIPKEKFDIDLVVEYYDGEPTTDETEENNNENEVVEDV